MKKTFLFLIMAAAMVACGRFEPKELVVSDAAITGYWLPNVAVERSEPENDDIKCTIIKKPGSKDTTYPKAYSIRDRVLYMVFIEPKKAAEPEVAIADILFDGTVKPYAGVGEKIDRVIPTGQADQLQVQFTGAEDLVLFARVDAKRVDKVRKIAVDCQ